MVAKFTLFLTAFATLAFATPIRNDIRRNITPNVLTSVTSITNDSQCDTGSLQCCNTVGDANSKGISSALGLLGLLGQVTGNVGLGCTNVVGVENCAQQPVCCDNNHFGGLVNVGCSPIAI